MRIYRNFLVSINQHFYLPYPLPDLLAFLTFLHRKGLACSTIRTYLSALSYYNKLKGGIDATKFFAVQQLLTGLGNLASPQRKRLPLYPSHIKTLISALYSSAYPSYSIALFAAMLSLGFALALRIGEMTKSRHNLALEDISLHDSYCVVSFTSYKHSKASYPMVHVIKSSSLDICPIPFLRHYLTLRGTSPGPFFLLHMAAVPRKTFSDVFKHLISLSGFKGYFSPHSLRIGAATNWSHSGLSDSQIRQRGRWRSDAFKSYIRGVITH